ncbi:hypothetical protein ACFX16_032366 [Malus domestica]
MASSDNGRDGERNKKTYLYLLQSAKMAERKGKKIGCGDRSLWRQEYRASGIYRGRALVGLFRLNRNPYLVAVISMQITALQASPTPIMEKWNWMSHRR